jgi:hypothetical protein
LLTQPFVRSRQRSLAVEVIDLVDNVGNEKLVEIGGCLDHSSLAQELLSVLPALRPDLAKGLTIEGNEGLGQSGEQLSTELA